MMEAEGGYGNRLKQLKVLILVVFDVLKFPMLSDMVQSFSLGKYRKIPNKSPGHIEVRKHFLGGLYSGGGLRFGGHFVLLSEYQDFKIHCYISLL